MNYIKNMKCYDCGKENSDLACFCKACGFNLVSEFIIKSKIIKKMKKVLLFSYDDTFIDGLGI